MGRSQNHQEDYKIEEKLGIIVNINSNNNDKKQEFLNASSDEVNKKACL